VVKEALACNCPVVATEVGDTRERLANVSPSFLVSRDPGSIADALIKILSARRRCNGRDHVLELGIEQVAQRVVDVYRKVKEAA
jgi:glycosyltransferase involved in cell wall biosynthesis